MVKQDKLTTTKSATKLKAAIYSRVSTAGQDFERQTAELKEYAEKEGYEVVYCFEEQVSGKKDNRPEFNKLRTLTKDDIDIILVWELSRLSRNAITLQIVVKEFVDKGIQIYSAKERRYTLDKDGKYDVSTQIVIAFAATMAEAELESIKERMHSGRIYRVEQGYSYVNRPSYGYYLDEQKYLRVNEEEAVIVKRIFQMCINGYSAVRIASELNAEQIAPAKGRKGNKWLHSAIEYILRNTAYYGCSNFDMKDIHLEVQTPAIIDEATFKAAQAAKASRKRSSNTVPKPTDSLLRGLIVCSKCGNTYTTNGRCYICWTRIDSRANAKFDCDAPQLNRANLDYIVWELISKTCAEKISADKLQSMLKPIQEEIFDIDDKVVKYQDMQDSITKQIQKYAVKMLDLNGVAYDAARARIKELEGTIKQYQNEIDLLEARYTKLNEQKDAIENNTTDISITEFSDKREVVLSRIDKVVPYRETKDLTRIEIYFKDGRRFGVLYQFNHHIHKAEYCLYENRPANPEFTAIETFDCNKDPGAAARKRAYRRKKKLNQ